MDIAKQDIAAVIRISGQTWVVTQSGQWFAADEVTTSLDSFEIINLTQSQVDLTGEQPQVFVNGDWLTLPSQVIDSIVATNINNQSPSSNDDSASNQQINGQQGSNFFYQFIQRDADEAIAESGFDTTADNEQDESEDLSNPPGNNSQVLLPELSVTIADGGDEWINQFETPSTDLFGQAKYANNGQALTVTLTDINGKTITLNTTAQDQAWRIDDIDLSSLAEGQIIADVALTNPIVNADINAQDTSVKDTIAEITVNIEQAEQSNNNQQLTTFSGEVVNIQNGQTVVVTL